MAFLHRGLQLVKSQNVVQRLRPVTVGFTRNVSYGDLPPEKIPPRPKIRPPGPEWVDQGWNGEQKGNGWADYPNWVEWSYQNRDPRPKIPYDDPQMRRYFGEPLHVNDDILSMHMPDVHTGPESYGEMMGQFLAFFGALAALWLWSEYVYDSPSRLPVVPKPYPYNNLYLERGGDPNREPTAEELSEPIFRWYSGFHW